MIHVVIMAGGSGTRFWPASRAGRPKQFLSLAEDRSLLRQTFERVKTLVPVDNIWVVTNRSTVELTARELPDFPTANILAEPVGRDTAACVGYAAVVIQKTDSEAVCVVLPADHVVGDNEAFCQALRAGAEHVRNAGGLLSFGVCPTSPETGYGYLRVGEAMGEVSGHTVHYLDRFVEKPDYHTAATYLSDGGYLWNAGIFAWRTRDLLDEIRHQLPALAGGLEEIRASLGSAMESTTLDRVYPSLQRISVDYGVMEGAQQSWVVPVSFAWSDVGSWSALPTVVTADETGNWTRGRVLSVGSHGNIVLAEGAAVAVVEVDNLIVVTTKDAVLVVPRERAQRVKDVAALLQERGWTDLL